MYLIFDTETTGLVNWGIEPGLSRTRIMQLGALLLTPDFDEIASFCSLIQLPEGTEVSQGAFEAHGISLAMCQQFGIPIESALSIFDEFAKLADYMVAFNLKFDTYLLSTEMLLSGRPLYNIANGSQGICAMLASTKPCGLTQTSSSKPKWPKLQEAVRILLKEEMQNAHSALVDCRYTGRILQFLLQNNHIALPKAELSQP